MAKDLYSGIKQLVNSPSGISGELHFGELFPEVVDELQRLQEDKPVPDYKKSARYTCCEVGTDGCNNLHVHKSTVMEFTLAIWNRIHDGKTRHMKQQPKTIFADGLYVEFRRPGIILRKPVFICPAVA